MNEDFTVKAHAAASSAQLLFKIGDNDGACDRAYFALRHVFSTDEVLAKNADFASTLAKANSLRLDADMGLPVVKSEAEWCVAMATKYVALMVLVDK